MGEGRLVVIAIYVASAGCGLCKQKNVGEERLRPEYAPCICWNFSLASSICLVLLEDEHLSGCHFCNKCG
jgi:hypothetical protein